MVLVLGLTPVEWTAVGTITLAVVTGVYVVLTWRLASHAKAAAIAARKSAESAERSVRIAESSAEVDFGVTYASSIGLDYLIVKCLGATVYIRGLRILIAMVPFDPDDPASAARAKSLGQPVEREEGVVESWIRAPDLEGKECDYWDTDRTLPVLVHRSEEALFVWPGPERALLEHGENEFGGHISVAVLYSFEPEGSTRERMLAVRPMSVDSD